MNPSHLHKTRFTALPSRRQILLSSLGFLVAKPKTAFALRPMDFNGGAIELGRGFFSVTSQMAAPAFSPIAQSTPGSGTNKSGHLSRITDAQSLYERTNIDASASFNYGLLSASANYDFDSSIGISSYNEYLLVRLVVEFDYKTLQSYHLTDDAIRTTRKGKPSDFYETYGDAFVSDIHLGGYLYALITFEMNTKAQYDSTSAMFNFSDLNFGSVSADLLTKLQTFSSMSNANITIIKNGGSDTLPDMGSLIQEFQNFSLQVKGGPEGQVVTSFRTSSYNLATNRPLSFHFINLNPQLKNLQTLASWISDLNKLQSDVDFVIAHPEQFVAFDQAQILSSKSLITSDQSLVLAASTKIMEDPFTSTPLPTMRYSTLPPLPSWHGTIPLNVTIGMIDAGRQSQFSFVSDEWAGNIDNGNDQYGVMNGLSIQIISPVDGLSIKYEIDDESRSGPVVTGQDGAFILPHAVGIIGVIRVWLEGPIAPLYRISYKGWKIYVGETPLAQNGSKCETDTGPLACIGCDASTAKQRIVGKAFRAFWIDIRGKDEPTPA